MPFDRETDLIRLSKVPYPGFRRDIVASGVVKHIDIDGTRVRVDIDLGAGNPAVAGPLERSIREALLESDEIESVQVRLLGGKPKSSPGLEMAGSKPAETRLLPEVRHTIAIASGKGGVGKSTVAVNLAMALAASGARVGLLDADLFGPSLPTMLGLQKRPVLAEDGRRILPFEKNGVRFMSLGFLVDPETAVIWRGPLVMKALEQLLRDVVWGELDILVLDLPPGTGDTQLTLSQRLTLSGAVIVSTPQDVALADAYKGIQMFQQVGVPILGWIENMSGFCCPHCGKNTDIFGSQGVKLAAGKRDIPFLGALPLDPQVREAADAGTPIVLTAPDSDAAGRYRELAVKVRQILAGC
jgi:ATP-binding protein involved in chromosome partitioning